MIVKKLEYLRQYLLASTLQLQPDNLRTFTDRGRVMSFQGDSNQHFELRYSATVMITDYPGEATQIAYLILQWLKQHQPNHAQEAIQFEAEILSQSVVNLSLKVDLSEMVKVRPEDAGTHLNACAEPNLEDHLADQTLGITIEHNPDGPPQARAQQAET